MVIASDITMAGDPVDLNLPRTGMEEAKATWPLRCGISKFYKYTLRRTDRNHSELSGDVEVIETDP